eukprot:747379-Hanusia_phi.AAC.3
MGQVEARETEIRLFADRTPFASRMPDAGAGEDGGGVDERKCELEGPESWERPEGAGLEDESPDRVEGEGADGVGEEERAREQDRATEQVAPLLIHVRLPDSHLLLVGEGAAGGAGDVGEEEAPVVDGCDAGEGCACNGLAVEAREGEVGSGRKREVELHLHQQHVEGRDNLR